MATSKPNKLDRNSRRLRKTAGITALTIQADLNLSRHLSRSLEPQSNGASLQRAIALSHVIDQQRRSPSVSWAELLHIYSTEEDVCCRIVSL